MGVGDLVDFAAVVSEWARMRLGGLIQSCV